MDDDRSIWLINNEASGSNDAEALTACEEACEHNGLRIAHRTVFPDTDLPSPAMLDAAGTSTVAIYAGDGTINAALLALAGWGGQVLILPGGTMNLLYHRLFGDLTMEQAVEAVADGSAVRHRPVVIESGCGTAFAGVLAGPGTAWSDVREAMRDNAALETLDESRRAMAETMYGERLRCDEPQIGKPEGYPLILLTPVNETIVVDAYHAEGVGEFVEQLFAVMRREFREGPHDRIGQGDRFVMANVGGGGFGVLLDGEACEADGDTEFRLARCGVDLLATRTDG